MKRLIALLVLFSAPGFAASHIAQVYYSPDRVVRITGQKAIQTMIEFRQDERIENIALGDSAAWQVTPNKRANLLFVKPLIDRASTNMTVITDKRRYLFELVGGGARARALYSVRFVYAEDFVVPGPVEPPIMAPAPPPPLINTNWQAKGEKALIPARIYDDGVSTFVAWDATSELPAILTIGTDGAEGPVNYTVKGDDLVIDGVAARYVLRIGKASAVLTNLSPRPAKPVEPKAQEARAQ
ncbi:MAG: Type secretion system protein virB9 precursor [Pseudomonadota bacterium]